MLYHLLGRDKVRRDVQIDALVKQFHVYCPYNEGNLFFYYLPFTGAIKHFTERYGCRYIGNNYYSTSIDIGNTYARKEGAKYTIEGFLVDGYI